MSENSGTTGAGIGFCTVLFLVFLVLKLCEVITWSWWWVSIPLWGPWVLIAFGLIVAVLVVTVRHFWEGGDAKR